MNQIEFNVLGYHARNSNVRISKNPTVATSPVSFADSLNENEKSSAEGETALSAKSIAESYASKQADLLKQIGDATSQNERDSLADQYRQGLLGELSSFGIDASADSDVDKVIVGGTSYDLLGSLNKPGRPVTSQFLKVGGASGSTPTDSGSGKTPTRSIHQVVFQTADQHGDLIAKINNAPTQEERLGYVDQLREIIEQELNAEGHDAYSYGSRDKLVINDTLFDLFYASTGVGMETRVQMLNHGPAADHGIFGPEGKQPGWSGGGGSGQVPSNHAGMIFSIGAGLAGLLSQISGSFDMEERRELGLQFQQKMVDQMTAAGLEASAHSDPDKIVIGNNVYDVIQSLNKPGHQARLQALKFA